MSLRAATGLTAAEALAPRAGQLDLFVGTDGRSAPRAGAEVLMRFNPLVSGFARVAARLDREPAVEGLAGLRVRW